MAVVIASDLAKDMVGEPLLRGVSFKLERRDRMTLSGRNGSGKTTLLRMLAGETSIDGGELVLAKGTRLALHDQRPPRERSLSLRDYVLTGAADLIAIEARLAELEQAMAGGATDDATLDAYARAQARLEHAGGYRWRDRATSIVHGLGFTDEDFDRPLSTFSGGELTRASLARALAGDPDLLLLDEPTNHLDIASLEWLEQTLVSLDAAVVLVAHDRWFLEAVGTSVLELEAGRSRFFPGPWHAWRKEQAARDLALGRAIERQQAEIARLERFVERFRAGTRSRQAQARVKRLDKIDRIEADPRDGKALGFSFKPPERSGRVVFELEHGRVEVPGRVLLDDAELWLERGEHVALVGPNGSGKTTLVQSLAGRRPLDGGKLRTGHNVNLGYLSQHAEELDETGVGARGGAARDEAHAQQRARAARPLPVLGRGGREAGRGALGRRAPAPLAGDPRPVGRQRAGDRRAHQPPGPREPRGAGGRAARLRGLGAARLPRPRAARRRRHAHDRARGRRPALLRGRLGGLPLRARAARGGGEGGERAGAGAQGPEARARKARPARRRTPAARRSSSSETSRRPRPRSPRWRTSSPIRPRGPSPAVPRSRPSATSRRRRSLRSSTRSGRKASVSRDFRSHPGHAPETST